MEGKDYDWEWVTGDQKLCNGPCDLLYAYLVASGTTSDTYLYDGVDTNGKKIVTLESNTARGHAFSPKAPVRCEQGLYVDFGSSVTGLFVQWRKRPE